MKEKTQSPVSKASEGEGMARVAHDLEDLILEVTETVGDHLDRVGLIEARSSSGAGDGNHQKEEYRGCEAQSGHGSS